jgi:hypothetical protein
MLLVVIAAGFFVSFYVECEESKGSAAVELVKMTNSKEIFQKTFMASFEAGMKPLFASGQLSIEKQVLIKAEALAFADNIYSDPEFVPSIAQVYEQEFTEGELKDLIAFYRTPLGKKTLEKMPKLMQVSATTGQRISAKHQATFQAKMQSIMAK